MRPPPRISTELGTSPEDRSAVKQKLAERRLAQVKKWDESFRKWVAADESRREQLVHAYNRVARGRIVPQFQAEPLEIARWGPQSPQLKGHQIRGARRVLANRGGGVFFDVGVGKTYTALAIIARARQEGWVRRPVILVPGSLVWKWHDDILCTLPDYRVAVIGSKRKRISRGVRRNVITSEPDTPQERAKKWTMLQTGQVDVVVLSYDALARTKMNEEMVLAYVDEVEAVARSIALRKRNLAEKTQSAKAKSKLTERELALLEHGTRAWVEEILALPGDWEYDPGVAWDDIGIDMLVVDEAAAFKNLYKPQPREDGVPKFMGGGGEGSDRAWQLDFRAAAVRRKTGGAGVVLLTATPAKNSPLEFYNLIQFIDPTAFTKAGILDPEQFIDRFLRIEQREVLDAAFEVTKKSAVVGFKNLDDLRTIIFTYGEFRSAAEVGLKLPEPVVIGPPDFIVKMDDEQEAKYARYVAQIENILEHPDPEGGKGNVILGLLARLSLIALHPALEDGYTYKTALEGGVVDKRTYVNGEPVDVKVHLPRPTYTSPKLAECAKRVAASPHCGHIIFCEPTAVHQWMREELVQSGIPRERIAILNAEETAPADRIRIAREFNGLSAEPPAPGTCARPSDNSVPPKYDVVIANSVAYEGVDLQVRTCTIHHLDLPWTPADLEQRNGRAVRQGNTLGTVNIFYYFADGSTDGYRFSLIDGKAGWLGELIKSQVRDTNNPAAQQQLTPEDILLMISRNKEKTAKLLEEKRQRQAEEARVRVAKEAGRIFRQAAGRFRDARLSTDLEKAARLREEGEQRLTELEQVSPDAWPWATWMYAVRDTDVIVPESGGAPVYEGLRLARPRAGAPGELDFLEFGRILATDDGEKIGLRAAGSPSWQLIAYTGTVGGSPLTPTDFPRDGGPMWPEDDDTWTGALIERRIEESIRYGLFESLNWRGASDAWLEKWWPRFADRIAEGFAASYHGVQVPVVDKEGLAIASGAEIRGTIVLPPTRAGWQKFLELAPGSGQSFTVLREIGLAWWDRKIPPNLLSEAKERAKEATPGDAEAEPAQAATGPVHEASAPYELSAAERAEEQRMGDALRSERDREEAQWAEAVERGTKIEMSRGLGTEARRTAIQNLGRDIHHYDDMKPREEVASDEQDEEVASPPPSPSPKRPPVPPSFTDHVIATFNAEPGFRLRLEHRGAQDRHVFSVSRQGDDPDEAIASFDALADEVTDVRWLDPSVRWAQQRSIQGRLERALADATLADSSENERVPRDATSSLQPLIDTLQRLGHGSYGLDLPRALDTSRTDPLHALAVALRDLAEPTTQSPEGLALHFEELELWRTAAVLRDPDVLAFRSVYDIISRVWTSLDKEVPLTQIKRRSGGIAVDLAALGGEGGTRWVLLREEARDTRYRLRQVDVTVESCKGDRCGIQAALGELRAGQQVYLLAKRNARFLSDLVDQVSDLERTLRNAPRLLADVRQLLLLAGALIDTHRCQGKEQAAALRAFEQAKHYHDQARYQLVLGKTAAAAERIHGAMRRIATAAAQITENCAAGQQNITPVRLPVEDSDAATLEEKWS